MNKFSHREVNYGLIMDEVHHLMSLHCTEKVIGPNLDRDRPKKKIS